MLIGTFKVKRHTFALLLKSLWSYMLGNPCLFADNSSCTQPWFHYIGFRHERFPTIMLSSISCSIFTSKSNDIDASVKTYHILNCTKKVNDSVEYKMFFFLLNQLKWFSYQGFWSCYAWRKMDTINLSLRIVQLNSDYCWQGKCLL